MWPNHFVPEEILGLDVALLFQDSPFGGMHALDASGAWVRLACEGDVEPRWTCQELEGEFVQGSGMLFGLR
ncbi:MAG: hypothetical protein KC621_13685, partial [Myxococcales bacterium]|nr:hypothetical protein [Myxococcales bacterium]